MVGLNYYLLSLLSRASQLAEPPTLGPREFLDRIEINPRAHRLARVILLSDDLLQREACLAGELDEPAPSVLTTLQASGEEPLPESIQPQAESTSPAGATDGVWEAFFRHAANLADAEGSSFLAAWVGFEVALRNELVEARARALEIDPGAYLVAEDLAASDTDLSSTVNEWASAPDPLAGQRLVDEARWDWLERNDAYFSFGDDELLAHAARLMLQQRWQRIQQAQEHEPATNRHGE